MKSNFNILTGRENVFLEIYDGFFVHKEILLSLNKLFSYAKKELNADLKIISGFRDFDKQLFIWNSKATGKRKIIDENEQPVDIQNLCDEALFNYIARFSAIPGLSRHHWGTDLDIYDANKLTKDKVQLTHSECISEGPFAELHSWLDEVIRDNRSFGFFRPYDIDFGGIAQEKWHLSYKPISDKFYDDYNIDIFKRNIELSDIEIKSYILNNIDEIFHKYFKLINKA